MNYKVALKVFLGVIATPVVFGLLLFLSAGAFDYWQGWVFLAVFSIATAIHSLDLFFHDPEVLQRRMRVGPTAEKRLAQRIIMMLVMISFFLVPIVAGLDHRYGWSNVPAAAVLFGDVLIALSYVLFYFVLKQNRFAAANIEVVEGQKVSSTGLYGVVRHPMYVGALLLMIGVPLALGSYWALLVSLLGFCGLLWRIVDEEKCLVEELAGYAEYCTKVKCRLVPGLY